MPTIIDPRVAELKALGNHFRLLSFELVLLGELCVNELTEIFRVIPGTISQHLKPLVLAKLVVCRRQANLRFYRATDPDYGGELIALLGTSKEFRKPGVPKTLKGRIAAFLRQRAEDAAGAPIVAEPLRGISMKS